MDFHWRNRSPCRRIVFGLFLQDTLVTIAYTDVSGSSKTHTISSTDLSESWTWKLPDEDCQTGDDGPRERRLSPQPDLVTGRDHEQKYFIPLRHVTPRKSDRKADQRRPRNLRNSTANPARKLRRNNRRLRKLQRIANLVAQSEDAKHEAENEAISRSENFQNKFRKTYTIWRKPEDQNPDDALKIMRDQIAMAKVYAFIARSKEETELYDSLIEGIKQNQRIIREAHSDSELSDLGPAKSMGEILSTAKNKVHDCSDVEKKLRVMIQYEEENLIAVKRQSSFLTQRAAVDIPTPLHCLSLQLTTDYFLKRYRSKEDVNRSKLEDPSLYHYAIFSDNVLATSVVVNSTLTHVKEPEKHVFHIVSDGLNYVPMKMWFLVNCPPGATVHVENMDEFKWLNSSLSPVLRQLELKRLAEYYFGSDHPSSLSLGDDNLKYRNFKYLSMLNHIRFYLPELYPKLEKILFLDDDVAVRKDLTPLWSIDMEGMVNGAVMTCKDTYHRLDTYLNFSNPEIASNFHPKDCAWAFGMNIFDLKAWKKRGVTEIYHRWQEMNSDRRLWKLGTLPPGLIAFYNQTYVLEDSWHVLGLGHESDIQEDEIEKAAVVHYNGNYKPWSELAICRFRKYWSDFVRLDNPYLRNCGLTLECRQTQ